MEKEKEFLKLAEKLGTDVKAFGDISVKMRKRKAKLIVWHVCSIKKFLKYLQDGRIRAPVRAWIDIKEAERFSKQTGRQIILRLKFDKKEVKKLPGHKGKAVYIDQDFPIKKWFQIEHLNVEVKENAIRDKG